MSKERSYISKKQKEALVDFIENHPDLNKPRYDINTLTHKQAAELWTEAARVLNRIPGGWKPWKIWRKCWQDIKNDVRQKLWRQKKYEEEGGKESKITLTEIEERISILIYEVHISGHQHVPESAVNLLSNANDDSNSSDPEINVNETCVNMPLPRKRNRNVSGQRLTRTLNITAKNSVKRLTRTLHTASQIAKNIKIKNSIKRKYCAKKLELLERLVKAKEKSNDTKIRIAETNERSLDVELQIAAGIERIGESLSNIENILKINRISLVI